MKRGSRQSRAALERRPAYDARVFDVVRVPARGSPLQATPAAVSFPTPVRHGTRKPHQPHQNASVAQLDRASVYGTECREFESLRMR